ncbi:carbohydrate kinase family protein [Microbacterium sp. A8/3-1]|uniref:Carbohydrate kinase family protein n=1 Tax=Microbacterium sp. A8/3-1 TaxID=3160749 RepID=A0AAU7VZW5_9MICO
MIEVFGDAAWHIIVDRLPGEELSSLRLTQRAGGPAATVAMQAALLGAEVTFSGTLGADDAGNRIARELALLGVTSGSITREGKTATVLAEVGSETIRLGVELEGVVAPSFDDLPVSPLCYATGFPPMTPFLERCAEAGLRLIIDVGFQPLLDQEDAFAEHLTKIGGAVGIGIVSGGDRRAPKRQAVEILLARGAEAVIVTLGRAGLVVVQPGHVQEFPAIEVEERDALCAGDCFVAGLLVGLDRGWGLTDAVLFGQATAAAKVSRFARLADKELVAQLLASRDGAW